MVDPRTCVSRNFEDSPELHHLGLKSWNLGELNHHFFISRSDCDEFFTKALNLRRMTSLYLGYLFLIHFLLIQYLVLHPHFEILKHIFKLSNFSFFCFELILQFFQCKCWSFFRLSELGNDSLVLNNQTLGIRLLWSFV